MFAKSQAFRERSVLKIFKFYLSARNFLSTPSVFHHLYNREMLRKISAWRGCAAVITLCTYIYFASHRQFIWFLGKHTHVFVLTLYLLWTGEVESDKKAQRPDWATWVPSTKTSLLKILDLTFLSFHFFPHPELRILGNFHHICVECSTNQATWEISKNHQLSFSWKQIALFLLLQWPSSVGLWSLGAQYRQRIWC